MTLARVTLRRMRTQILSFGLGLAVWGGLYVFIFPVMRESMADIEYPQEILSAFGASGSDLSDPRLFFDVEFFSLVPSIAAVFAVIAGTGALAGEESGGTIDFVASLPVSRQRLFLQKALAVATAIVLVTGLTTLGWIVTWPATDYGGDLTLFDIAGATMLQTPWLLLVAGIGMLLGAIAPRRGIAAAWTGGFVVAAYLLVALAGVTEQVEDLRYLSPYYYTDLSGMLESGPDLAHQLVLWATIAATFAAALRAFDGRELSAERWQWDALLRGGGAMATEPREEATAPGGTGSRTRLAARIPRPQKHHYWIVFVTVAAFGVTLGVLTAGGSSLWNPTQQRSLSVTGRVDADSANVVAPTTGAVRAVLVAQGDEVRQGQVIAWVTSSLDGSEQPVVAPLAGSLTALSVARGQSLVVGSPLGEVHRLDTLRAVFEVAEGDLPAVAAGRRAELTLPALGLQVSSEVTSVAVLPVSEVGAAKTKPKYEVRCSLPDADPRVLIGMRVEGRIERAD